MFYILYVLGNEVTDFREYAAVPEEAEYQRRLALSRYLADYWEEWNELDANTQEQILSARYVQFGDESFVQLVCKEDFSSNESADPSALR